MRRKGEEDEGWDHHRQGDSQKEEEGGEEEEEEGKMIALPIKRSNSLSGCLGISIRDGRKTFKGLEKGILSNHERGKICEEFERARQDRDLVFGKVKILQVVKSAKRIGNLRQLV